MAEINTIEEARAEILRLEQEVATVTAERETLSQNNTELTEELHRVRTLNQEQFLQLRAQSSKQTDETDDEEQEVLSCEDFAKTIKI